MATREDALHVLENAGIDNIDTDTPLDRAEITRRFMEAASYALETPTGDLNWQTPLDEDEDLWASLDYHAQPYFGGSLVWPESAPKSFGAAVLEIERHFRQLWKRTVSEYETNPRHCGSQAAFYGVRDILRTLYSDDKARWRPSTLVEEVLPLDKREQFERRIGEEFGIVLPTELKVFGQVPYMIAWWIAWLLSLLVIIGTPMPGGLFLVCVIIAITAVITIVLLSLSRHVWSDALYNLGDIACHIVAEQAKLREALKKAADIPLSESG